jgi:hypothetical protein
MSSGDIPLRVSYVADPDLAGWGIISFEAPDGKRFGFGVSSDEPEVTLLVSLASGLQENIPEIASAWGQARPRCPGHTHPASPLVSQATAWWACPIDDHLIAQIGSFASD